MLAINRFFYAGFVATDIVVRRVVLVSIFIFFACSAHATIVDGPTTWPGGRWVPEEPSYGMVIERKVPIIMDDGAVIYADIGYPTDPATGKRAEGEFPVLLTQTPYNIPGTSFSVFPPNKFFVARGYIYVVAQVRGSGFTEGPNGSLVAQEFFSHRQALDGAQLVDWVAHELKGSNGVVGLDGCSFMGITQIFTAAEVGPNSPVKAMIPACAGNGYDIYFPGGMLAASYTLSNIPAGQLLMGTRNYQANIDYTAWQNEQYYEAKPLAYIGEHWQIRSTANAGAKIVENGIPALLWSGWRAAEVTDTLQLYSIFQNAAAGLNPFAAMTTDQPLTGRYQMIVGSGGHGSGLDSSLMLEWFDHWLKGQATGIDKTSTPMHLFEQRGSRWVNAKNIPAVENYTTLYADAAGVLANSSGAVGQDSVRWAPPKEEGSSVSYTSTRFSQDTTIAGPISVSVWASSSNTNMELIVDLYDVSSWGTVKAITNGALIGSMRAIDEERSWRDLAGKLIQPYHPYAADVYLEPGESERFYVNLVPTLWRIAKGHSLRLKISSQAGNVDCGLLGAISLPRPCAYTRPQEETLPGGIYTIHRGGDMPTSINLPLVNSVSLPTAKSAYTNGGVSLQPMDWGS